MTTDRKSNRMTRTAALLAIPALGLLLSTSTADAHPNRAHQNGNGHAYGHAKVVRVAGPHCVATPTVVVRRVYAPYTVYTSYPVYAPPIVRPYPVAPIPYGSVVINTNNGNVGGFVGLAGPNFSLGIGF